MGAAGLQRSELRSLHWRRPRCCGPFGRVV